MKVLLLNTYLHGGAGIACRRLQAALLESGESASLLTRDALHANWPFYAERLSFLPFERDKSVRFSFSLANFGKNLAQHPMVQQVDILHLHWINQGFLSLENIRQLGALGKPLVWTLHDMWAFTGGCHYSGTCVNFQQSCGNCPYLRRPGKEDLSYRIWRRKQSLFPDNIQFVTCSEWLAEVARSSSLLSRYPVCAIPNPIDTQVYQPAPESIRAEFRAKLGIAKDANVLLFVAMKVTDTRKGFSFLLDALQQLQQDQPGLPVELLVLGRSTPEALAALPYPVHALGLVQDELQLAQMYNAADLFVIPSLEDNLPNTVMEALACGTPVAGFHTGGIPEMVEHLKAGYIAPQGDSKALATGIAWVLTNEKTPLSELRRAARRKAEEHYTNSVVARQYVEVYEQVLKKP